MISKATSIGTSGISVNILSRISDTLIKACQGANICIYGGRQGLTVIDLHDCIHYA